MHSGQTGDEAPHGESFINALLTDRSDDHTRLDHRPTLPIAVPVASCQQELRQVDLIEESKRWASQRNRCVGKDFSG